MTIGRRKRRGRRGRRGKGGRRGRRERRGRKRRRGGAGGEGGKGPPLNVIILDLIPICSGKIRGLGARFALKYYSDSQIPPLTGKTNIF